MKNELAAVAVVVALIVGAGIGYSGIAGNAVTRTETLTTTTSWVSTETVTSQTTLTSTSLGTVTFTRNVSVPCQVGPWSPESNTIILSNGTHVTRVFQPVFLMKPGSRAAVCVTYHNPSSQTIRSSVGIGVVDWGPNSSGFTNLSTAVIANSSQSNLALPQGQNATVIFGLDASSNATGFYGIGLGGCVPIPMAVGYQASQVNLNDFPGLYGIYACTAAPSLSFQITGFSGGTLAYYTCTLTPLPRLGEQIQYCK